MNLRDTYNLIAVDNFAEHLKTTWWREGVTFFISQLPEHAKVLDVGCGVGYKAEFLEQHGVSVTGIDFSESMLSLARKRLPTTAFICADIQDELPLRDRFDGIFAESSLLHIKRDKFLEVVQSLTQHLNPGGMVYVSVKEMENGVKEEVKKEEKYGKTFERFFSYFTLQELVNAFDTLGMDVVFKKNNPEETNWLQVIAKKRD